MPSNEDKRRYATVLGFIGFAVVSALIMMDAVAVFRRWYESDGCLLALLIFNTILMVIAGAYRRSLREYCANCGRK